MATEHDDDIDKMLEEYESEHRNQSPATALVPPLKAAPLDKINTNNRSPTPQSKDRKYHSPSPVKESKYRSSDHENGKEKDRSSKKHRKERKHSHRHKERKEHKDSKRLSRSRSRKRSRSSPKEKKMKRERDDEKELSIHRRRSVTPINERKYRSPSPPRKTKMDIPNSTRRSRSRDLNNDLNLISKSSGNNPGPRSRSKDNDSRSHTSRTRDKSPELSPEERDMRTVFCMQLAARIRPRDLEEFFSQVGKARDVRLITDPRTRRSKGVAYVEFRDLDCVTQAIALSGQKVLGVPIIIKPSNAEKNRLANQNASANNGNSQFSFQQSSVPQTGPMKLYVGSLHFNITEDMLRGIFEPFGRIESINLMKDTETSRSRGYAFIQFAHAEDAKRAMENLNGFELAGRPMKVGHVTERVNDGGLASNLDSEELDQRGINLGATGRLALMAKLADGSGLQMPQYALNALNMAQQAGAQAMTSGLNSPTAGASTLTPVGTQCFMLSNMFDPVKETKLNWKDEIRDEVIEECNKFGGCIHLYVDQKNPNGNVYIKTPTIASAINAVNSLHGRFFSGRVINASYIPIQSYHQLFPEAINAQLLLVPTSLR